MPSFRSLASALTLVAALHLTTHAAPSTPQQKAAPATAPQLSSRAEQEDFLKTAKIVKRKGVSKGITGTVRITMTDGTVTHDASVQAIDDSRREYQTMAGTEFNFRDTWQFNIAAYLLDKLMDLNMIPATVERVIDRKPASVTWWVDDVLMDEGQRMKTKQEPPSPRKWNEQMWVVRVFDQLIYNTDRNVGNLLITTDWRIWMIDHSRAFRWAKELKTPGNLTRVNRKFLEAMRKLDEETLKREVGKYLGPNEIAGLLARRDAIVAFFDKAGPSAIYDLPTE